MTIADCQDTLDKARRTGTRAQIKRAFRDYKAALDYDRIYPEGYQGFGCSC